MNNRYPIIRAHWLDLMIGGFVFLVLLFYTYAYFVRLPYLGFEISSEDMSVIRQYPNSLNSFRLLPGDRISAIDGVSMEERFSRTDQEFIGNYQKGDRIKIELVRKDENLVNVWIVTGVTGFEFTQRLFSYWYLAYIFWAFGLATSLYVRPRDDRWKLLVALDYLMALWIIIGACSQGRILFSGVLMRAITWLILPVSLALHLVFPRRIVTLRPVLLIILFGLGMILAVSELLLLLPANAFYLAILGSIFGSLILITYQWFKSKERRVETRLPFVVLLIFIVLAIESNVTNILSTTTIPTEIILLFAPLLPMGYFYAIYTRKMGDMEIRLNRWIGIVTFFALIILPAMPILAALQLLLADTGLTNFLTILFSISAALLGIYFYPIFIRWFGKTFLGIPSAFDSLFTNMTTYLSSNLNEENLVQVLTTKVFPGFLIRQALILRLIPLAAGAGSWNQRIILQFGIPQPVHFSQQHLQALLAQAGQRPPKLNPPFPGIPDLSWVRLVLPLSLEQKVVGLCLLGCRDPDDAYSSLEFPLLQSIMDQVTLTLVHIEQTRNLRAFLQADIHRQEDEKMRSARRLHDAVLGQLTVLGQNLESSQAGSRFVEPFQETVRQVREVIAGLRPSALNFGLEMAISDLVDRLSDSNYSATEIILIIEKDPPSGSPRYEPDVELQIYRIVQQACQNALQHASARHIWVKSRLAPGELWITVEDDGRGFETNPVIDYEDLLSRKQYGLVGMAERAALVDATLAIISAPSAGTEVRLHWQEAQKN